MKARLLRRVVFALLVGVFLLVAGLLGVNVYLNGEYLPKLVRSELAGLDVRHDFAWSVWPGRLHFEDLRLRGEEHGFAWEISAGRARVITDVGALLDRRLALERLVLSDVTVRLRPRVHYLDATPEYLAVLPSLPFAEGDLLHEGPALPPALRPKSAGWAISIPAVEVEDLRAVHVERYNFEGRVDAQGSLSLTADRVLTLGDTRVELKSGNIRVDGLPVLKGLAGQGRMALDETSLGTARGSALLSGLRGESELRAEVVGLPFLPSLPGLPLPIELEAGTGPLRTVVSVKNGAVQPGAVLEWDVPDATLRASGFHFRGALGLRATVVEEQGASRTRCQLTFDDFRMGRDWRAPLASGKRLVLGLDAPNVDLSRTDRFAHDLGEALRRWPAQLAVDALRLTGEERTLQWEATLERLSATVDVSAAQLRTLLLTRARGAGAKVRVRPRLEKAEASAQALRFFPPIDGLPTPPLKETTRTPASLAQRAAQNPWSVRVEDARVEDLRELWLETYRFEGKAAVQGGFLYAAGGQMSAGPLELDLQEGALHVARWRAAKGVTGRVEATARPFDLQEAEGYGFFRHITSRAELSAQLDEVDFIRHFPTVPMPAELGGGQGPLHASVAVRDGVVQAGSLVRWETKAVQASTHGHRFVGPFSLEARWADAGGEPRLRLEGRVSPYRLTRVGDDKALVGGKLATLRIDSPKFDLARPSFEPVTQVQVVDGQVPDLRAINGYIPSDLRLKMEAGAGTFTGKVAFPHRGAAWAEFKVAGRAAALTYDKVQVKGDWSCEAKLGNVSLTTGDADILSASVVLNNMAMREGSRSNDGWFGRVDVTRGKVRPGQKVLVTGALETTMRDGRPLVSLFAAESDLLPGWARSLITLQALRATSEFRLGQDMVELDRLAARGQSLEIRGRVRKQGQSQWGDMLVLSRGQEVGLALRGARVEFKLIGAAAWYRAQMLEPRW
jgi:hypothetical protein